MSEAKGCKKCNQKKGIPTKQLISIIGGFYILFASIYGTVVLINKLIELFK
jgi:hypothetical protein